MTYAQPSLMTRKCQITIPGSAIHETGTYAVFLDGSDSDGQINGYAHCPNKNLPDELFTLCQDDGQDVCFTLDEGGTHRLPCDLCLGLQNYHNGNTWGSNSAIFWVAVPLIAGVDSSFWVWYQSNSGTLVQPADTDTYGSKAVWNGANGIGNMAFVSHDGGATDSTGNVVPTIPGYGNTVDNTYPSLYWLGNGIAYDSSYLQNTLGTGTLLDTTGPFTIQMWLALEGRNGCQYLCNLKGSSGFEFAIGRDGSTGISGHGIHFGHVGSNAIYTTDSSANYHNFNISQFSEPVGSATCQRWHHYAISYNGSGVNTAANYTAQLAHCDDPQGPLQSPAVPRNTTALTTVSLTSGGTVAGENTNTLGGMGTSATNKFSGLLSEIRFASVQRSANYLQTDFQIQNSVTGMTTDTPEDATVGVSGGGPSVYEKTVAETLTLSETKTVLVPIRNLKVSESLTVSDHAAVIGSHSLDETLSLSETTHCKNVTKRAAVAETLSIYDTAPQPHGSIRVNVAESLLLQGSDIPGLTVIGLQDLAVAQNVHGGYNESERVLLTERASCMVVHVGGKLASVSETLTLTDNAYKNEIGTKNETLTVAETATVEASKPVAEHLILGEMAHCNVVRNLSAADVLVVEESFTYINPYVLMKREYAPQIGGGVSGNPTPPPSTLALPSGGPGQFTLFWPPTGTATDVLVLRKPEFGNKDRLQFNRISRETRGGTLIVFADPMWPKIQTQVLTFSALKPQQAEALLQFMLRHIGLEIGMWDWEGRRWTGVIVNPNDPAVQDSKESFTASLEFEGTLS